jgi:hypothetical protein
MVFGWPAFWWLEYYAELHCLLVNERIIVFDLRE